MEHYSLNYTIIYVILHWILMLKVERINIPTLNQFWDRYLVFLNNQCLFLILFSMLKRSNF